MMGVEDDVSKSNEDNVCDSLEVSRSKLYELNAQWLNMLCVAEMYKQEVYVVFHKRNLTICRC